MGVCQAKGRRNDTWNHGNKIVFDDSLILAWLLLENSLTGCIGALCLFTVALKERNFPAEIIFLASIENIYRLQTSQLHTS